jgi:hypothetical protein
MDAIAGAHGLVVVDHHRAETWNFRAGKSLAHRLSASIHKIQHPVDFLINLRF